MRALLFSDCHIGEYPEGITTPGGLNSRLVHTLAVWDHVKDIAQSKEVGAIIFAGDRFRVNRPPTWIRDLADEKVASIASLGIPLYLLVGNHDIYNRLGTFHSLMGIDILMRAPHVHVISDWSVLDIGDGISVAFAPYGKLPTDQPPRPNCNTYLLVFHDEIIGVSQYNKFISKSGLPKSAVDDPRYDMVIGGHIHYRQELSLEHTIGIHIGSPLQRIEDGDQGPKGVLILDTADMSIEFIELPLPTIRRLSCKYTKNVSSLIDANVSGHIICMEIVHNGEATAQYRSEVIRALRDAGAAAVDVRLVLERQESNPIPIVANKASIHEEFLEYVNATDPSLVDLARSIL